MLPYNIQFLKKMSVALDCTLCVITNYTYCTVFVSVWNNAITEKLVICVQGIGPSVSNDLTWSNACHVVLLTINISLFLISLFFLFTMFYTNPWRNVHTSCWLSKGRVIVEVKNVNLNISVFRSLIWCMYHCVHLLLHGVKKNTHIYYLNRKTLYMRFILCMHLKQMCLTKIGMHFEKNYIYQELSMYTNQKRECQAFAFGSSFIHEF